MSLTLTEISAVPFVRRLETFGDRAALITSDGVVSYSSLAAKVEACASRLGTARRLVMVAGGNDVQPIVAYLAALSSGNPVILVPGDNAANLAAVKAAYDPDVVICGDSFDERRAVSAHDLHPSLGLLLSTSGSTGSPKLVRLSDENLQANAESIAAFLSIRPTDVAATTLPMHYCYGLSVINSHLLCGASLLLSSLSVVDMCFWDQFRAHGGTTFAGVPYTFDLLDRIGFDSMDLPSLRYVTQAGGRMAPSQVTRYAALGHNRGFDLFVMYGQTEATARMAYLPPELITSHPNSIGMAIPGGSFSLAPVPDMPHAWRDDQAEIGELVYSGDNVMLGYAESPTDLSLGRLRTTLYTGDIARRSADGLYEIIGRRSRSAKIFGLRIDLEHAERVFVDGGVTAYCADGGEALIVAVESDDAFKQREQREQREQIEQIATRRFGLPPGAVRVCSLAEVPRLASGKPDYRAITVLATGTRAPSCSCTKAGCACAGGSAVDGADSAALRSLYAKVLNRSDVCDEDSFVTLKGDSLSYVEMSIRLEEVLGHLPPNWHVTPIGELAPSIHRRWRGFRTVETNVLLRALAIVLIVGSHANVFAVAGGAHLLFGLVGFNFARFHLTCAPRLERVRHLVGSIGRIAVPSITWIALAAAITSTYSWQTVTLLNGLIGPTSWTEPAWHYWFIEALVYTLLALTLVLALPLVDRIERRWSFWLPVFLAGLALLTRYEVVVLREGDVIHRAHIVFWLFAIGWAAAQASSNRHRLVVSALVVSTIPGFFDDPAREMVVIVGLLLLVWVRQIGVPTLLARASGVLASASLYVYLSHWQIYPHLEDSYPLLALAVSLAVGIGFWRIVTTVSAYRTPGRVGLLQGTGAVTEASPTRRTGVMPGTTETATRVSMG